MMKNRFTCIILVLLIISIYLNSYQLRIIRMLYEPYYIIVRISNNLMKIEDHMKLEIDTMKYTRFKSDSMYILLELREQQMIDTFNKLSYQFEIYEESLGGDK